MIRAYNTETMQYLQFQDYLHSLIYEEEPYGEPQDIEGMFSGSGGCLGITLTGHGYYNNQYIYVDGTDSYDGQYQITRIDDDSFEIADVTFDTVEEGRVYADMDYDFYVVFLHDIEDVFDEVKLRSATRGKALRDKEGKSLIDQVAMTEDNRDMFELYLREGSNKVYDLIHAYSKGIINAYKFNQQINFDDASDQVLTEESPYYLHFAINEDRSNQDENMYNRVDRLIFDAIVAYVLKEWYLVTPLIDTEAALYEQRFNKLSNDLNGAIMMAEGHKRVKFDNGLL